MFTDPSGFWGSENPNPSEPPNVQPIPPSVNIPTLQITEFGGVGVPPAHVPTAQGQGYMVPPSAPPPGGGADIASARAEAANQAAQMQQMGQIASYEGNARVANSSAGNSAFNPANPFAGAPRANSAQSTSANADTPSSPFDNLRPFDDDSTSDERGDAWGIGRVPCPRGGCSPWSNVFLGVPVGGVFASLTLGVPILVRLSAALFDREAIASVVRITQAGLEHSFERHAAQWFGRVVAKRAYLAAYFAVPQEAAKSGKFYLSRSGGTETIAQLARVGGRYIILHYNRILGEFLTAVSPSQAQLTFAFRALGITK